MDFLIAVLLLCTIYSFHHVAARPKDPEFCHRGFLISGRNHQCWEQATYANPYPELYERHNMLTGKFVEEYAVHMCSVVKPKALDCLRKEVARCSNAEKLVAIADESGGACTGNHLNPFFKLHILDHLVPIPSNSTCFDIADKSYECYEAAGAVIKQGEETTDIGRFHKVADKFFNHIWDCLIKVFKSNEEICKHWQIPMLLSLQKTAMPSLFGMRLNNEQVRKLELEDPNSLPDDIPKEDCESSKEGAKMYVLLKVVASKPEPKDGELVLELNTSGEDGQPGISMAGLTNQDVESYVDQLINEQISLKEIKTLMKEKKKKNREINNYLKRIRDAQTRQRKQAAKKNGNSKRNNSTEGMIN